MVREAQLGVVEMVCIQCGYRVDWVPQAARRRVALLPHGHTAA
jgi:hypothetical protein